MELLTISLNFLFTTLNVSTYRWSCRLNAFWHKLHTYFLSSLCVSRCLAKALELVKDLLQVGHCKLLGLAGEVCPLAGLCVLCFFCCLNPSKGLPGSVIENKQILFQNLFCQQNIKLGINTWINISKMFDNLDILKLNCHILAYDQLSKGIIDNDIIKE